MLSLEKFVAELLPKSCAGTNNTNQYTFLSLEKSAEKYFCHQDHPEIVPDWKADPAALMSAPEILEHFLISP